MRVAVVGAGSTYTPELVSGLGSFDVPLDELALMDVDDERLDVVGGLATRMLERTAWRGDLSLTTDLDRAVEGADFVLVQIRVGGQAARLRDETIPLACGCIGQETTGAGGFAKAMRTVPVMLQSSPASVPGSSTSRTRWGSSPVRCSTQAIAPSASATSRSGSSAVSRICSAWRRSAWSSTRSASTT
jgi:6-phospho-beta-glucosidase